MNLLVSEVLKLDFFKNSEIIAGKNGLENEVSFATVMDVPDIIEWLHGGEILLAAKLFAQLANRKSIELLNKKRVSAVITKPKYIQSMDQELLSLCDDLNLPIILVQQNTSWGDILNPITQLIAKINYQALYESQRFHSTLMSALIKGIAIESLAETIYDDFGVSLAIAESDFSVMSCSPDVDWNLIFDQLVSLENLPMANLSRNIEGKAIYGHVFTPPALSATAQKVFIFPTTQNRQVYGYIFLCVPESQENIGTSESMKIEQLGLVVAMELVKRQETSNTIRRYNNLLLDRIMNSEVISSSTIREIEHSLNCHLQDSYRIALVKQVKRETNMLRHGMTVSRLFQEIAGDRTRFRDVLCFERSDYLVFFLPTDNVEVEDRINTICQRHLGDVLMSVSEATHNKFLAAYSHADLAMKHLERQQKKGVIHYSQLGVLRFFINNKEKIDTSFLQSVLDKYVRPLEEYDKRKGTFLKQTVLEYIESGFDVLKTKDKLYIHKNTLYARLKRVEKILDIDLSNSDDILNLHLALSIDQVLTESVTF